MNQLLEKALSTSTGSGALYDDVRDRAIASEIDTRHPLWANLDKKNGQGAAYLFSRKTARAGAAAFVSETGQAANGDASYASVSEAFRVLSALGSYTQLAQVAGQGYIELQKQAVSDSLDDWADEAEERLITGTGVAPQPTGLNTFFDAYTSQQLSLGVNGGALTLLKLDEGIDLVTAFGGKPDMIVTSNRTRREINALLQAQQRFMEVKDVRAGFRVRSYDDIPIFDSRHVVNEVQGTSTVAHRLNIIDRTAFFIAQLMPPRPFELARTQATVVNYEVLGFLGNIFKNRNRVSQLKGIIPAP
jgi:hypothetical protein